MDKTPGPNVYELPSELDKAAKKHKGFPFGVSREVKYNLGVMIITSKECNGWFFAFLKSMESTGIMGNLNKKNPGKNMVYYLFLVG